MIRRFVSIFGTVCLSAAVVAGCGGEAEMATGQNSANPAASQEAASTVEQAVKQAPASATKAALGEEEIQDRVQNQVEGTLNARTAKPISNGAAICELSGAAGTVVSCPVRLATENGGVVARALQGTIGYDASQVSFTGFFGKVCPPNADCIEAEVAGANSKIGQSGHTMSYSPKASADWKGQGTFILVNMSDPKAAINSAQEGSEDAREGIFVAKFRLNSDIRADSAVLVQLGSVVVADDAAQQVSHRISDGVIVTGSTL
jgi:hypothetical protein